MTVQELFKLIPEKFFDEIGLETKVDNQVKKLTGKVVFKLILFSMLDTDKMSLRVMETLLSSSKFTSQLQPTDNVSGCKYNSIRDRICSIKASYFEKFFETIFGIYNKQLQEENALSKVDSTCISLAAKLLTNGMRNSKIDTDKRFLKYTISLTGSLPSSFKIFTEQSYISEDKAMGELIDERNELKGKTVVFDRGIQSRKNFERFTADGKDFITRSKLDIKYNSTKTNPITLKPANSTVTIVSDETAYLYTGKHIITTYQYRVIKAIVDASQEEICFVSNLLDEDGYVIAACYKQRWEIEIFFKFIKQHLNVKHLLTRNENGMKVMLYMTMILAILIITYKKLNNISSIKIAKLKFEIELENEIIKQIVILCGGNPNLAPHLFNKT
jgi:Transposase DDE domain